MKGTFRCRVTLGYLSTAVTEFPRRSVDTTPSQMQPRMRPPHWYHSRIGTAKSRDRLLSAHISSGMRLKPGIPPAKQTCAVVKGAEARFAAWRRSTLVHGYSIDGRTRPSQSPEELQLSPDSTGEAQGRIGSLWPSQDRGHPFPSGDARLSARKETSLPRPQDPTSSPDRTPVRVEQNPLSSEPRQPQEMERHQGM